MCRTFLYILAMAFLAGCATPEYNSAKNECSFDAFRQYPVNNVPTIVTKTRAVKVPTGQINCSTHQSGSQSNTSCTETMKTEYIPYQETDIVDTNADSRRSVINNCAAQLCYSRYGNATCKKKVQPQSQPVTLQDVRAKFKEDYRLAAIAAEQGDAQAQANLGQMYETGRGVTKDDKEAVKWYRLAAEQRHVDGQSRLGAMYENGRGVAKDYDEALRWYRLSADQGNATAQLNIDTLNQKLTVVKKYNDDRQAAEQGDAKAQANFGFINAKEKNYTEAMKWFRLAAEQGNASAQSNLGVMYQNGHGVPQDYARAHMWFNLASAAGYANGTTKRDIIEKKMTPQQIEKAQEMAKACQASNFKGC